MAEPLTPIERKVYHFLLDFLAENTYQPSIREIGKKFRIKSTKTVSDLLQSLSSKGYIERDPSRSRGVRIVGYSGPTRVQPLPVYDRVAAGDGGPRIEDRAGHVSFDRRFVPGDDAFVLRMKGDALKSRGILDGDYVVVSPSAPPQDGDIVAVRFGDETTIRTLGAIDAASAALGAAQSVAPTTATLDEAFAVVGVVCGVFRPFFDREAFDSAITT
jgi:repressor LexA